MNRTKSISPPFVAFTASTAVCGYLGVVDDPDTYSLTLEIDNYCYNRRPKRTVDLDQQRRFCLAGAHESCPFFRSPAGRSEAARPLADPAPVPAPAPAGVAARSAVIFPPAPITQPLPAHAAAHWQSGAAQPEWSRRLVWAGALTVLLAIMAIIVYFSFWARINAQAAGAVSPVGAQYMATGDVSQVLVHVAGYNEDWPSLALRYNTSEAVLTTVNSAAGEDLAPGRLLVILPGVTDPSGLGPLFAYWITESILVSDAAASFDASQDEIRFWNQIQGDWVEGQRWLVLSAQQ